MQIKAPQLYSKVAGKKMVFLAGSIEMGTAENWQEKAAKKLEDLGFIVLNPRRDDWDSSWKQDKNNQKFREQVEWELQAQETCDAILMYFSPETKSPITLLELGLFIQRPVFVVCLEGFWRKGNVDIVCERYALPQYKSIEDAIHDINLYCA